MKVVSIQICSDPNKDNIFISEGDQITFWTLGRVPSLRFAQVNGNGNSDGVILEANLNNFEISLI